MIQCKMGFIEKISYEYDSDYDMPVAWIMTMVMASIGSDQ